MRTLVLLVCLLPGLASAGSLYRCISRAGHVSYQSASCPPGQRTDRAIEYVPDPVSAPIKAAAATSTGKRVAWKSQNRTRQGQHGENTQKLQPGPCARAKAKRQLELERLGLKRSFDDLSRIDQAVRAVCNGY